MEKLFPITAHECCFFFVLCVQFGMNCKYNSINLTSKYKCCFFYVIYLCLMTHWYNYIKVNMEFQIVKKFAEISVDSLSRFKVLWNWRVYKTVIATLYIYICEEVLGCYATPKNLNVAIYLGFFFLCFYCVCYVCSSIHYRKIQFTINKATRKIENKKIIYNKSFTWIFTAWKKIWKVVEKHQSMKDSKQTVIYFNKAII